MSAMQLRCGAPVPMMTEGVSEACSLADALAVFNGEESCAHAAAGKACGLSAPPLPEDLATA
jgi:hypothetical protein